MKKTLITNLLAALATTGFSQGWVGTGTNLFGVNSSLAVAPLNIGIGTNAPTAQLHTTGTVRFEGLTNNNLADSVLVSNGNGNIFWRDAATIAPPAWLLNGNNITSQNFLGSLNNENVRFRVANQERMIIDVNGNVGIGTSAPNHVLTILSQGNSFGAIDRRYLVSLNNFSAGTDAFAAIKLEANASQTPGTLFGTIGMASLNYNVVPDLRGTLFIQSNTQQGLNIISSPQGGIINNNFGKIRFFTGTANFAGNTINIERMRIDSTGFVGINTVAPSANLHSNGTVRFQNLPSGSGNIVVIDNQGNLFRANQIASRSSEFESLKQEVTSLKNEIAALKKILVSDRLFYNSQPASSKIVLSSPLPNPAESRATFRYKLPASGIKSALNIYDSGGKEIWKVSLPEREGTVTVNTAQFENGIYFAIIASGSDMSEAKRLIISK